MGWNIFAWFLRKWSLYSLSSYEVSHSPLNF